MLAPNGQWDRTCSGQHLQQGCASPNQHQLQLDGRMLQALRTLGQEVVFPARTQTFLNAGSEGHVWLVRIGWLFMLRCEADGRLKTGELLGTGDLVGISGLWDEGIRPLAIYSLTDVYALQIPGAMFEEACAKDPQLGLAMMRYMAVRYRHMASELHRSTLLPLAPRIQSFLAYASDRLKSEGGLERINLSQAVLSWAVGAHPVSVSRAMTALYHHSP